jgi:hypothetical protein
MTTAWSTCCSSVTTNTTAPTQPTGKESYDLTWGRLDLPIYPVAGNHEYLTGPDTFGDLCPAENATAEPYFDYFGSAAHPETRGHYSFDMGNWHLIGLNSNCDAVDGCGLSSVQTIWLKLDLAANAKRCVLAFWHQPLFEDKAAGFRTHSCLGG